MPAATIIEKIVYQRRVVPRLSRQRRTRWTVPETLALPLACEPLAAEPALLSPPVIDCDMDIKRIVEAILFAANKPMTIKLIQQTFPEWEQPDSLEIQQAVDAIIADYADRPVGLIKLASGYRFQIKAGMSPWVSRLFEEKPARYSRALLETVAIIAYRQPVTRGEIEDIRGVSVSTSIVQTLLEREWIRVIAHKEVPGRPALYGTTKQFLDYFNLSSLSELPTLQEIVDFDFSNSASQQPQQEPRERLQTPSFETEEHHKPAQRSETQADDQKAEFAASTGNDVTSHVEGITLH